MRAIRIRWMFLGLLSSAALVGCDGINVVDCDEEPDADICQDEDETDGGDDDPGEDAAVDGGRPSDSGIDARVDAAGDARAGDGSASADSAQASNLTIAEFCEAQLARALAWRDSFDLCCIGTKPAAVTDFLGNVVRYVEDAVGRCEDLRGAPIAANRVTYDGTKAAACANAYIEAFAMPPDSCPSAGFDLEILEGMIGHGAPALVQVPACREAFKGTVQQGQPCEDQFECAAGLRCVGETGDKTCETTVASGGTCFSNAECADNLTCVGNSASGGKQCREVAALTGKCGSSSECEEGLVCRESGSNPAQCVAAKASTPVCMQ